MTTPEQEKPTEGLISKIEALTDDIFNSLPAGVTKLDTEYPVHFLYPKDISAIAMIKEDLSSESLISLQDKVRELEVEQQSSSYNLEPQSVFGKWLQNRHKKREAVRPLIGSRDDQTSSIEVIEPLRARSQSVRIKTFPDCFAYGIEKVGFSGHLIVDGLEVELNMDEPVIAINKMRYDPDDFNQFIYPEGQEHYALVPSSKKIYQPESAYLGYYGKPLSDAEEVKASLESIIKILGEIKSAQNPKNW